MNKIQKKKMDRCCYFCEEDNYSVLDVHRIIPGEEGGEYTDFNTLTCCANCHRKCHSGAIKILGKYYCTSGKYVVYYMENNEEKWK